VFLHAAALSVVERQIYVFETGDSYYTRGREPYSAMPTRPPLDHPSRIDALRTDAADTGLDGLVLTRRGSIAYVTGVWAPWRSAVVVPLEEEVRLLTSKNDVERVRADTWIEATDSWTRSRERPFPNAVADHLADAGLADGRVGVEMGTADDIGVLTAHEYQAVTARHDGVDLVDATDLVNDAMTVKTRGEIERLRRANEICDVGIEAAVDALEPGISEIELAGEIERAQRRAGSEYNWSITRTEVGSGHKQARPNGFTPEPTTKRIQRGDLVTLDVHAVYDGYFGDLVANAVVGEPTADQLALEADFRSVAETLLDAIEPGAEIAEIVDRVDDAMAATDQDHDWVSYYGHGLGTSARCGPTIVPDAGGTLPPNTTLVAHAYVCHPSVGGMRLEMPVLVGEKRTERLSAVPLDLIRVPG
jgi:Xaa-Pro dipeptidase